MDKEDKNNQQEQKTNSSSASKSVSWHGRIQMPDPVLLRQAGEELLADEKRQKMYGDVIKGPIPKYY